MRYRRATVPGATYFFTLVAHERRPLFVAPENVRRWRDAVASYARRRPFIVEAEVILPDHLHALWTLPDGDSDYATRIRLIKTRVTKELAGPEASSSPSRLRKGERDIWQRRYWEHVIRDERDFQMHLDYIHYNPVKHGLAARPADWPHSTFSDWVSKGRYDNWWGSDEMPPLPDWARGE